MAPTDKPASEFERMYPTLAEFLGLGAELQVNAGGRELQIAGLYFDGQQICQFLCEDMQANQVFERLEGLAQRYQREGLVTDDLNGCSYSVW